RRHTRSKRDWSSDVCSSDLADRLHSSERRATGGENLQEQPVADGFARGGGRRKRRQRHGMSAAAPYGNQAGANDDQDGSNKKIRSEERRVGKERRDRWWREE